MGNVSRVVVAIAIGSALLPWQMQAQDESSSGRVLRVDTARGVSIEVIDWGGAGRPLVFLAGGGHSAREFDEFAPLLTDAFRVVGISRRGSGTSSDVPAERFDDHVDDIVTVLDTLNLQRVVLAGHSLGGAEMALFGELHGDRCVGLVYLDSAYDYADPEVGELFTTTPPPQSPPMAAADSASVSATQAWIQRTQNFRLPASEILATRRFDENGKLIGPRPSRARAEGPPMSPPRWEAIDCPSVGIYAIPNPLEDRSIQWMRELDGEARVRGQAYFEAFGRWTKKHRDQFASQPQNEVVEFPSSNHYFFLEQPQLAARTIREFVDRLP